MANRERSQNIFKTKCDNLLDKHCGRDDKPNY